MTSNELQGWDYHAERICTNGELEEEEKQKALDALRYVRDKLPVDVLNDFGVGEHELQATIIMGCAIRWRWLTWFAEQVQALAALKNGSRLLTKLSDPEKYKSTLAEIETAARLRQAGYKFDLEPSVAIGNRTKRPDFQTHSADGMPSSYIEVKHLRESLPNRRAMQAYLSLSRYFSSLSGMVYSGIIWKELAPPRAKEIGKKIQAVREEARARDEFIEKRLPGVGHVAFAPEEEVHKVATWAEQYELEVNSFHGPIPRSDEITRIKSVIYEKKRQLPADYPGIIVVKSGATFGNEQSVAKAIHEVEEEMYRVDQLAFVLVFATNGGNGTPFINRRSPSHSYAFATDQHCYAEYYAQSLLKTDTVIVLCNHHSTFADLFAEDAPRRLACSILMDVQSSFKKVNIGVSRLRRL